MYQIENFGWLNLFILIIPCYGLWRSLPLSWKFELLGLYWSTSGQKFHQVFQLSNFSTVVWIFHTEVQRFCWIYSKYHQIAIVFGCLYLPYSNFRSEVPNYHREVWWSILVSKLLVQKIKLPARMSHLGNSANECIVDGGNAKVWKPNNVTRYVMAKTSCKQILDMILGHCTTMFLVKDHWTTFLFQRCTGSFRKAWV